MAPVTISVVNHKGGVLKTTNTVNLAAVLVEMGKRVLVIDMDMQQNLSNYLLGHRPFDDGRTDTLCHAILNRHPFDELIQETHIEGLHILPCEEDFIEFDLSLASQTARELALRKCLQKTQRIDEFDFILIDCPPGMALTTVNALAASGYLLIPCEAAYLPIQGLDQLGKIVSNYLDDINPDITLLGVVMTKYHSRHSVCRQADIAVRKSLGDYVTDARIRVNTKAAAAPSKHQTIMEYEASDKGRGTQDYRALAAEVLERVEYFEARRQEVAANG